MRRLRFTLVLLMVSALLYEPLNAQITFQRTFGGSQADRGKAVLQMPDEGYLAVGRKNNVPDIYLVRTDQNGDLMWEKTYNISGTLNSYDYCSAICPVSDGNYMLGCSTGERAMIMKINPDGDSLWTRILPYQRWVMDVHETMDNGFIITGSDTYLGWLIKTNFEGTIDWKFSYDYGYGSNLNSVMETGDGYLATGWVKSDWTDDEDVYVVKVDLDGLVQWSENYGRESFDIGNHIIPTSDGGYAIAGYSIAPGKSWDGMLMKFNGAAVPEWTYYTQEVSLESITAVRQLSDNDFVFCGFNEGLEARMWLTIGKISASGDSLWKRYYQSDPGEEFHEGHDLQVCADGGYIVCGWTDVDGSVFSDLYLVKTDAEGLMTGLPEYENTQNDIAIYNYPNPFNTLTNIKFRIADAALISINILDANGRIVSKLFNGEVSAGEHMFPWDGSTRGGQPLSNGIYFLRLEADGRLSGNCKILINR